MATVLFATPHQDDETLTMGGSVRKHLEAGHEVHVLLLGSGINSGARAATGLSRPAFTEARDDEMFRACRQLGLPAERVHVSRFTTEDGEIEVGDVEDSIRGFLEDHPGAWVKSYSHLPAAGRHADHVNAGQAAVNLYLADVFSNLRLYVEPWLADVFRAANQGVTLSPERAANVAAVRAALAEYRAVDPSGRKYGIGYLSVASAFGLADADPVSWYHQPPPKP